MTPFEQFRKDLLAAKNRVHIMEQVWRVTVLSTQDEIDQLMEDSSGTQKPKYP